MTGPARLALATCARFPALSDDDWRLQRALARRGVAAVPAVWDDPALDWREFEAVVIRSTWDYHLRLAAFDRWIGRLEREGVPLWNPPDVLRWNTRKTYLLDLQAAGIPIVPTRFVPPDRGRLAAALDDAGWDEVVVKPVVSASAHETWRTNRDALASDGAPLRASGDEPVMVQPFLPDIQRGGEWSLCFFGGAYSHAVIKRPRLGDFRVQSDHGGVYERATPPAALVEAAGAALAASRCRTVYARVDGCLVDDVFLLMELELLEPGLFLGTEAGAASRLADAVIRAVRQE